MIKNGKTKRIWKEVTISW